MTFINQKLDDLNDGDFYIEWHDSKFRIDVLEYIDTVEWDGDLVALVRGIAKGASFEIAMKYNDYVRRLKSLESLGHRVSSLPKRILVA